MHSILIIIFSVIIGFKTFLNTDDGPSDPKVLGEAVFQTFQKNRFEDFEKLFFTEADCEKMIQHANSSDSTKKIVFERMKAVVNLKRSQAKENFQQTFEFAEKEKISLTTSVLNDVKFEIKSRNNIESSDIYLFCRSTNTSFIIKLDNCHKSDAWLMMGKVEIKLQE